MAGGSRVVVDYDVPVPMRDGTVLLADVYRPDGPGAWPALLQHTPYDKAAVSPTHTMFDVRRAVRSGYAVVVQDVRGRYASAGHFEPFAAELLDGHDTVEWVAGQPWCSGRVGMVGNSYVGAAQWGVGCRSRAPIENVPIGGWTINLAAAP